MTKVTALLTTMALAATMLALSTIASNPAEAWCWGSTSYTRYHTVSADERSDGGSGQCNGDDWYRAQVRDNNYDGQAAYIRHDADSAGLWFPPENGNWHQMNWAYQSDGVYIFRGCHGSSGGEVCNSWQGSWGF